jgi:hypothetical protein
VVQWLGEGAGHGTHLHGPGWNWAKTPPIRAMSAISMATRRVDWAMVLAWFRCAARTSTTGAYENVYV